MAEMGQAQRLARIEEKLIKLQTDLLAITDGIEYSEQLNKLKEIVTKLSEKSNELERTVKELELYHRSQLALEEMKEQPRQSILSRFKGKKDV